MFFVSVASKGVRIPVSSLGSTVPRGPVSVDSKQVMVAVLGLFVSVDSKLLIVQFRESVRFHPAEALGGAEVSAAGWQKAPSPGRTDSSNDGAGNKKGGTEVAASKRFRTLT
jgi:hypothetical protein